MSAPRLDPAVVAGLIEEFGTEARGQTYERPSYRDEATWDAVTRALREAEQGRRPSVKRTEPPAWLDRLVRDRLQLMATRSWNRATFDSIRTLERLGLVTLDADDTYVLAAVGGIGDQHAHSRASALRADPDLIDKVVWRMFEVEGGGEVSLANVDKFTADDAGWQATFLELSADGTLPRERLLVCALAALHRDFSAYRAGWYRRLYDALDPSADEVATHQAQLRSLLRSDLPATVGFAAGKLHTLSKQGTLEDRETLPALRPAVVTSAKTAARTAVRLIDEIATRHPGLRDDAADVAAAALEHPNADVQAAAGALLQKLDAQHRVEATADLLEPSVRADLLPDVGLLASPDVVPDHRPTAPAVPPTPVGDDDLIERLAALLEDASDPVEVELVLAGLAALDDTERLRPLAKRATTVVRRGPRDGVTSAWLRGQLARLVVGATGTERPPQPKAGDPALAFLLRRLGEVEDILCRRRPNRILLATPDDARGWLRASTLIERLQQRAVPPDEHDLVAALLRLHPGDRPDALHAMDRADLALDPTLDRAVRYALGAPPGPRQGSTDTPVPLDRPAVWIAASRSRFPTVADPWLASQGIEGAGRSEPIDARILFESRPFTWSERGRTRNAVAWSWRVDVARGTRSVSDLEPTAVHGKRHELLGTADAEDLVGWLAILWPHDAEHFLVDAIHPVLCAAESTEVSHDAVRVLDALGEHPGRLGTLAMTCLAAGFSAGRTDQRTAAVDAVVQLARAGRLHGGQLAAGLVAFGGPATLTRVAASMRDVAAESPATRGLVIDAIAEALPALDHQTRGIHALLELLREELLRHGRPTPAVLLPWLEQFGGSSRAAKTARALMKAG